MCVRVLVFQSNLNIRTDPTRVCFFNYYYLFYFITNLVFPSCYCELHRLGTDAVNEEHHPHTRFVKGTTTNGSGMFFLLLLCVLY